MVEISFLLQSKETGGQVAMFEAMVPAGAKVPLPHYHKAFDETIYGIEGIMTFTVEGKAIDIAPGVSHFIPRGAVHDFHNYGTNDAKVLAVVTPGLLGPEYFMEVAQILDASRPPDQEKLQKTFKKYGLIPVQPV